MLGSHGPSRASGLTLALIGVLLPALLAPAAAEATPSSRPGPTVVEARARLDHLTAEIAARAAALQHHRAALASVNLEISRASARLGALEQARQEVTASLERARERQVAVRAELDRLAAEAFMDAGPGVFDAEALDAFLGSGSFDEAADRLAYTEVVTTEAIRVAGDVAVLERDLEVRASALDALADAQTATVTTLEDAREAQVDAAVEEEAAFAALDVARTDALAVLRWLEDRLQPGHPIGLSDLGDTLQGADHVTYGRWAELFLRMVDAPVCRSNLVVMAAWQAAESTQAAWNPLATTHSMPGSTDFNSVGVQDFVSLRQGLRGTWETIENGWTVYRYGPIVVSLRRCANAIATARAINASSWCPGCVGGAYVLNVVPHVQDDLAWYLQL